MIILPWALQTACRYPGCSALAVKNGYCAKHSYKKSRTDNKESKFYGSRAWRVASLNYRSLHPICERCGVNAVELVHHKVELYELLRRGEDPCEPRWLEGLCWSCHEKTKRGEGKRE